MGFWVTVALYAGLYVLNRYVLAKTPPGNKDRRTQDDSPVVRDGVTIPIWYGKCRFDAPNLVWTSPRRGVHDPAPAVDLGAYAANMMFVLGVPGGVLSPNPPTYDRKVTWDDIEVNGVRLVRDNDLVFGDFYGETDEVVNYDLTRTAENQGLFFLRVADNMEAIVGKLLVRDGFYANGPFGCGEFADATGQPTNMWPAYRHQTTMLACGLDGPHTPAEIQADDFRKHFIYGRSPDLPTITITLTNPCATMIGATEVLSVENGNPNPVAVLYDVLTNDWARVGLPASKIDLPSFTTAAATLDAEGHSWGGFLIDPISAADVIREIMVQINGVIYEDPKTRQLRLKLIRFDYTVGSLPLFDASNVGEVVQFSTSTFGESHNTVRITYTDVQDNFATRTAVAQDLANITAQGGRVRAVTMDMPHIRNALTANQVASRELNEVSLPVASLKIRVNRDGYPMRFGDAFRFTWPELNMTDVVFRIQHIDFGQLGAEDIIIDAVQDVFALDLSAVNPTVPFPNTPILPIQERTFTEVPRYFLQQAAFSGYVTSADDPRLFYLATPAQTVSSGYTIYEYDDDLVRAVADLLSSPSPYPARAQVNLAYSRTLDPYDTTTGLQIKNVSDVNVLNATSVDGVRIQGKNLILVGSEFMGYETFTSLGSGVYRLNNVWRGLFDTPCVAHAVDERVYFLSDRAGVAGHRYTGRYARTFAGDTANAKFLPHVAGVAQNPDDNGVEADRLVARNRQLLPLPPSDLLVNSSKSITQLSSEGIIVGWKSRNRLNTNVIRGDTTAEAQANTEYRVKVQKVGPFGLVSPTTTVDTETDGDALVTTTVAGYGDIDVGVAAFDTFNGVESWDTVKVRAACPSWRNLVANGNFSALLSQYTPAWVIASGGDRSSNPSIAHGLSSPFYVTADGLNEDLDISQTIDITGYYPERLSAVLDFYLRMHTTSTDVATVTLSALDASGTTLTSSTFGPSTPADTAWNKQQLQIAQLPADTAKLKVRVQADPAEDAITTLIFTDFVLRVGHIPTPELLLNGNFQSGGGSLTSWTTVSGTWSAVTTAGYDGNVVATNNATGTGELRQDVALPTGFYHSTAVVTWAQSDADTVDGDTGQVIVEARDGSGVLISATSTATESVGWTARQLVLENIPEATTTLRVRLLYSANTTADVHFDAVSLILHKNLDPKQQLVGEFRTPKPQARPLDRGDWVEAFPTVPMPDYGMYTHGKLISSAFRGRLGIEPALTAPSGARVGKFVGFYNAEDESVSGPVAELQATDQGLISVEKNLYGNFSSAESFSVLCIFRNRLSTAASCGLAGRIGGTGWALELSTSGFVQARLEGDDATATATRGTAVKDGHPWMAWLIYDAVAEELHCVDPSGTTTVSTVGIGEIKTSDPTPFRIGKAEAGDTCLDGQIDVCLWRQAITTSQAASIWDHGESPTAAITASTRTGTVVLPIGQDDDGVLLASFHQTQLPIGKHEGTNADFGVAMNIGMTSLVTTSDFRNTTAWPRDGGATVAVDRQAPLGFLDGMSITGTNAAGVRSADFALSATTTVKVTWWARTTGAIHNGRLELQNSSGVVKGTNDFILGPDWQRYDTTFSGWDASTANGRIKFYGSDTGSSQQVEIAGPIYVSQSTFVPISVPYGGPVDPALLEFSASTMTMFNSEGEIYVEAFGHESAPGVQRDIVSVNNGGDNNDARTIRYNSASNAQLVHFDGTGTSNTATASGTSWTTPRPYRGRWNRAGMIETAATFSAINRSGVSTTGRAAVWAQSAVTPVRAQLLASNLLIPRFILFAGEVTLDQPV